MANTLSFVSFSLLFIYCTIASERQEDYNHMETNVTFVDKDANSSLYRKYLALLKKKYNRSKPTHANLTLDKRNYTERTALNESSKRPKWFCKGREMDQHSSQRVLLVNESALLKWINSSTNGSDGCAVVMFYTRFCRFSASVAAQFNAFGRAYNNTPVLAIDAYKHSSLNARFGVVAVPTILIFHAGKPVLKFNHSRTLNDLRNFVKNYTGLEGSMSVMVTDEDFEGPISSIATQEMDIYLIISTLFVFAFIVYIFINSSYGTLVYSKLMGIDWTTVLRWCKIKTE